MESTRVLATLIRGRFSSRKLAHFFRLLRMIPIVQTGRFALLGLALTLNTPKGLAQAADARSPEILTPKPLAIENLKDPEGAPLPQGAVARIGSQRFRHGGEVSALRYSPDGQWLASASLDPVDSTLRIWHAESGKEHRSIPLSGSDRPYRRPFIPKVGIAFSPDSKNLFIIDNRSIRVWDFLAGKELSRHDFSTESENIKDLAIALIAPDCKHVLVIWRNPRIQMCEKLEVRSLPDGKVLREIELPVTTPLVPTLSFSADSKYFLIGNDGQKSVWVFNLISEKPIHKIAMAPASSVSGACFFGDHGQLAILTSARPSTTHELSIIDAKSGTVLKKGSVDSTARCLEVIGDKKQILVGNSQRQFVQVIDSSTLKEVGRLPSRPSMEMLVAAPSGKRAVGACIGRGSICVWDLQERQYTPFSTDSHGFDDARFLPDGKTIALERHFGRPIVDWASGKVLSQHDQPVQDQLLRKKHTISPDGKLRVLLDLDRSGQKPVDSMKLIETSTNNVLYTLTDFGDFIRNLAFSGDSKRIATYSQNNKLIIWHCQTGKKIMDLSDPSFAELSEITLSWTGRKLIVLHSRGSTVTVVDVDSGLQNYRLMTPTGFNSPVIMSPNEKWLAAGGGFPLAGRELRSDSKVNIWDAQSGKLSFVLPNHSPAALRAAPHCDFSPDSRLLATGDGQGRLRLWELATGMEIHAFVGHKTQVKPQFSPDGRYLLATSADAPCYIWEVFPKELPPVDLERAWLELADELPPIAFRAMRSLVAHPEKAVPFVDSKLRPFALEEKQIEQWCKDLDCDDFNTRELATRELSSIALRIEKRLQKMKETASIEAKARLERILGSENTHQPSRIRLIRAHQVLGLIGTPEAKKILNREQWKE